MEEIFNIYGEYMVRILVALFLGVLAGTEREFSGKAAGIKTHGLVSMGSALFVVVSIMVTETYLEHTVFDPLRVAAHIIVGVGFIGGGAIFHKKESMVSGLTTAANLWIAAGIGITAGFGFYPLSLLVTLLSLFVFIILGYLERKGIKRKSHEE